MLVAILLIAGLVYAGMKIGKKQFPIAQPTPTTAPTVIPTPDETADWKTYTSEKYGFEMKYPDNWIVNIADDSIRFQTFPEPSPGYGGFPGGKNDIQISLSVKANSEGLDLEKFFAKQSLGRIIKSKQSIVLGNISGIIVTYDEEVGAGMPEVYSVANNFLIEGIVFCGSNDVKEKAISIFDQILSTFKFLDSTTNTVAPSGGTKVIGANLKEIKYTLPQGWEAKLRDDDLFISPISEGGYLVIRVVSYPGNIERREYYCQISGFCIEGTSYFTEMNIGNISGYKADALDNSGGGPEYFGVKGDKFYIISSFSPLSPNEFEKNYINVLNSLIF